MWNAKYDLVPPTAGSKLLWSQSDFNTTNGVYAAPAVTTAGMVVSTYPTDGSGTGLGAGKFDFFESAGSSAPVWPVSDSSSPSGVSGAAAYNSTVQALSTIALSTVPAVCTATSPSGVTQALTWSWATSGAVAGNYKLAIFLSTLALSHSGDLGSNTGTASIMWSVTGSGGPWLGPLTINLETVVTTTGGDWHAYTGWSEGAISDMITSGTSPATLAPILYAPSPTFTALTPANFCVKATAISQAGSGGMPTGTGVVNVYGLCLVPVL